MPSDRSEFRSRSAALAERDRRLAKVLDELECACEAREYAPLKVWVRVPTMGEPHPRQIGDPQGGYWDEREGADKLHELFEEWRRTKNSPAATAALEFIRAELFERADAIGISRKGATWCGVLGHRLNVTEQLNESDVAAPADVLGQKHAGGRNPEIYGTPAATVETVEAASPKHGGGRPRRLDKEEGFRAVMQEIEVVRSTPSPDLDRPNPNQARDIVLERHATENNPLSSSIANELKNMPEQTLRDWLNKVRKWNDKHRVQG